jgi:uncharacterized protein DUF6496
VQKTVHTLYTRLVQPDKKEIPMPKASAVKRAKSDKRAGRKPSTQAGEYVREEMRAMKKGSGNVRSRKQAIAIGLSEARRSGVKLGSPKKASSSVKRKASRDTAIGQGRAKPSAARSRGAKKAARTRERRSARS